MFRVYRVSYPNHEKICARGSRSMSGVSGWRGGFGTQAFSVFSGHSLKLKRRPKSISHMDTGTGRGGEVSKLLGPNPKC